MMTRDYDVIVIGGGGAGLAAAFAAAEAGASTLVIEGQPSLGGSTALSNGIFLAGGTSLQRECDIEDNAEDLYTYYTTLNQCRVRPSIVRVFCERAAPTFEWLRSLGLEYFLREHNRVDPVRRGHQPRGGGQALVKALEARCRERGVDIALNVTVERLIVDEAGRVTGIRAQESDLVAGAVIVACGGFAQNPEMLRRYFPRAWYEGRSWSVAAPGSRGDALRFAEQVHASTDGFDRGLFEPTPGVGQRTRLLFDWFVFVNRVGRRFIDESVYLSLLGPAIVEQGGSCWALLDEPARLQVGPHGGFKEVFTGAPLDRGDPALTQQIAAGRVRIADDVAALARAAGMQPALLERTVGRYNADCAEGVDTEFGKRRGAMRPILDPPLYAIEMIPGLVALTGYGLRTDECARVLDQTDYPIHGLYAAGEASGSIMGDVYVASGNAITNCIVFGLVAGETAASELGVTP